MSETKKLVQTAYMLGIVVAVARIKAHEQTIPLDTVIDSIAATEEITRTKLVDCKDKEELKRLLKKVIDYLALEVKPSLIDIRR